MSIHTNLYYSLQTSKKFLKFGLSQGKFPAVMFTESGSKARNRQKFAILLSQQLYQISSQRLYCDFGREGQVFFPRYLYDLRETMEKVNVT